MKIDFKETVWREVTLECNPEDEQKIIKAVKEGDITNCDDLLAFIEDNGIEPPTDNEFNLDTAEYVDVEDNYGNPTIEILTKGRSGFYKTVATN